MGLVTIALYLVNIILGSFQGSQPMKLIGCPLVACGGDTGRALQEERHEGTDEMQAGIPSEMQSRKDIKISILHQKL